MMKKVGILATSALAGTLLFAGTGFEEIKLMLQNIARVV